MTAMAIEQFRDLEQAGFSREQFRAATGREPTQQDVFNLHLQYRANGAPGVRSSDQLLDDVAQHLEEKFGVRRRINNLEASRRRSAGDMVNERRALRGLPPAEFDEPGAEPFRGTPVTEESNKAWTARRFGDGIEDGPDRVQSRKDAIAQMRRSRGQDPDVPVSRIPGDRRYADRQPVSQGRKGRSTELPQTGHEARAVKAGPAVGLRQANTAWSARLVILTAGSRRSRTGGLGRNDYPAATPTTAPGGEAGALPQRPTAWLAR